MTDFRKTKNWYRLKKVFEDFGCHSSVAMMMGLVKPQCSEDTTAKKLIDAMDDWGNDLDKEEGERAYE